MQARGQPWVSFLQSLVFQDRIFHWPGTFQVGQSGWPANPRNPPISWLLELGLQETMPGFPLYRYWGWNSGLHYKANTLLTELSLHPSSLVLYLRDNLGCIWTWKCVCVHMGFAGDHCLAPGCLLVPLHGLWLAWHAAWFLLYFSTGWWKAWVHFQCWTNVSYLARVPGLTGELGLLLEMSGISWRAGLPGRF